MGARVEDLATLLALETVGVPVEANRLPPLSKVDWPAALLALPHPVMQETRQVTWASARWGGGLSQIDRENITQYNIKYHTAFNYKSM